MRGVSDTSAEVVRLQTPKQVVRSRTDSEEAVKVRSRPSAEFPGGVEMVFMVKDGDHLYHLPLLFCDHRQLEEWIDEQDLAIQRYREDLANKPISVVYRAMTNGTFTNERAKAEVIISDLVRTGHLPREALEDF
jgi:hypothetical protein